jgi:nucleoside-diphosphate-sugar epimerase
MTISAKKYNEVNVFNGHAYRPILSINDLCNAVECIVNEKENKRGIYNITSFNENILEIGKKVADYMKVDLKNTGNSFTYDFSISSDKFIDAFDFKFLDSIDSIVDSIKIRPIESYWKRRDTK